MRLLCLGVVAVSLLSGCQSVKESHTHPNGTPTPAPSIEQKAGEDKVRSTSKETPLYTYRVVKRYPHDPKAFTQGLEYYNGFLYESTGLEGQSSLRKVAFRTGRVLQIRKHPPEIFAEGITLLNNRIYQLTWRNGICFVYERDSFRSDTEFRYTGEGWGLTNDGTHLIMSDGSDTLTFRDPTTFAAVRQIRVKDQGTPVRNLNELEYVNGEIWANVWMTDLIVRISPKTGEVLGWIDLSGLLTPAEAHQADVLNGIAYDRQNKRIFVTGKLWPWLFEIEVVPKQK
ncbi:MAG: glutamine cyclotransferase [Armatimonadota bacterium]